jgi:hypothetical protein
MRGELLRRWGWLVCVVTAAGCGFTAPGGAVTGDGGIDAPLEPATVSFAGATTDKDEKSGTIQIPVELSRESSQTITVPYRIVSNSGPQWATPGADFVGSDGTLTFDPGERTQNVELTIIEDSVDPEDNEMIALELQMPTGDAVLGATPNFTINISAVVLPRVKFTTQTANGGEATTSVQLGLTITPASTMPVTVGYSVGGDAETSGFPDHNLAAGSLTIPAGATTANIPVTITNDMYDEEDEHLVVTLVTSTNAVIDQTNNVHIEDYTITDNDNPPDVRFQTASVMVDQAEAAVDVTLVAETSIRSEKEIMVTFGQNAGVTDAATPTADFTYMTGATLTWTAGTQTLAKNIVVHVEADAIDEFDEFVETVFSSPSNVNIPAGTKSTLKITDDDAAPTVGFDPGTPSLGEIDETDTDHNHDFNVVLSTASGKPITVMVTVGGSATYDEPGGGQTTGWDFTTRAGDIPVTFMPGETTKTIRVTVRGDNTDEPGNPNKEDVTLTLASPTNATLDSAETVRSLTIVDDE